MRSFGVLLVLSAVVLICATAAPIEDSAALGSNAEDLLSVDTQTAHENESSKKARQVIYFPGLYSGYGYGGYSGFYAGYGGYGAYGYRRYPYYGYGYYPYSFYG